MLNIFVGALAVINVIVGALVITGAYYLLLALGHLLIPKDPASNDMERVVAAFFSLALLIAALIVLYSLGEGVMLWLSKLVS